MIPLSIAEKLLHLAGGEQLPASKLKHAIIDELIDENIIARIAVGRTRGTLCLINKAGLDIWLYSRHEINDLEAYISGLKDKNPLRAQLIQASNNSKIKSVRTYKGFLVNSYMPIHCMLNGQPFTIHPTPGTFQFIYDIEHFVPADDVIIAGVENMENFR